MGRRKKVEEPITTKVIHYEITKKLSSVTKWIYTIDKKYLMYYQCEQEFLNELGNNGITFEKLNDPRVNFIDSLT